MSSRRRRRRAAAINDFPRVPNHALLPSLLIDAELMMTMMMIDDG